MKKEYTVNKTKVATNLKKINVTLSDYVQQNANIKPGSTISPAPNAVKNFTIGSTKGTIELL